VATLSKAIVVDASPADVWDAVRDFGNAHHRLFPNTLQESTLEGDERVVTFGNGRSVHETLVTSDDEAMRLVYAIIGGDLRHYNASLVVTPQEKGSRVVWTVDLLPHDAASTISRIMDGGLADMKATLEATPSASS
jgi:hypothetical protein